MAVRLLTLLALTLALLAPGQALAQDEAPAPAPAPAVAVSVKVATIHAKVGKGPAPTVEKLVARLRKAFPGYHTFVVLGTTTLALTKDGSGQAKLPNGSALEITYLGRAKDLLRLRVALPPRLKTEVRVADGATFYQAGVEHDGGVLILALKATTKKPPAAPAAKPPKK